MALREEKAEEAIKRVAFVISIATKLLAFANAIEGLAREIVFINKQRI